MTHQSRAEAGASVEADDAAVIQLSRHEPEYFTVLFRGHAPYIQRYVVRRLPWLRLAAGRCTCAVGVTSLRLTCPRRRPRQAGTQVRETERLPRV